MDDKQKKYPRKKLETSKARRTAGEWRPVFLKTLEVTGNISEACKAAKVMRQIAYDHRDRDPEFAAQWKEAHEAAIDALELTARARAMGVSDTLLIFLLKAHRPAMYRERFEVSGPNSGPMQLQIIEEIVDAVVEENDSTAS